MHIRVSLVTIAKWIKKFDQYFKSISDAFIKNLYLGDSNEWHAAETVVKINAQSIIFGFAFTLRLDLLHLRIQINPENQYSYSLFNQA